MAEQELNLANVGAPFKQVTCKGMPHGMRCDRFRNFGNAAGYAPVATGRGGCPPFVQRDPYLPRVEVASRIALGRVSIASRSWTADDGASLGPEFSAARESDSSRSSSSSPLSRPLVPSGSAPD